MSTVPPDNEQLRAEVRARYGRTAVQVLKAEQTTPADACCGPTCCSAGTTGTDPITSALYNADELGNIPVTAALASRGCGNPTALAELAPGERVLDLGSGGGIDVLLSARRVGPTGFAYGLDMTDEMLALAEHNRVEAGIDNVRFLKGVIEAIPLPEHSVDVVISNCVINLSADKGQVLREAYRVLASGGRLAVSDIVFQMQYPESGSKMGTSPAHLPVSSGYQIHPKRSIDFAPGQLPPALRTDLEAWAGCIAGALEEATYRQLLNAAGFIDVEIEVTRRYSLEDISNSGAGASLASLSAEERHQLDGKFISAFIRARKP